ncbi:Metal dependent phosphohydrolase (fragment) [Petrocella atlantisensis]|uniref:Metal dependent phosphohydrolase n=1 Tax=Petrocella atlantisensis TaxID=2173034 RepID=A0A3P7RXA1_9FIRM
MKMFEFTNYIPKLVDPSIALDGSTKEHCKNVMIYAERLGRSLGYLDIEKLKYAAYFHDIGKLNIPEEILSKPSKLTEEEYEIIKKHPQIGYEYLNGIGVEEIQDTALYHHERMDGEGYPMGFYGDQIPVEARIVAIADVYDALTSDRPYREAMCHEDAIRLMKNDKGAFDQKYLVCFINTFEYDMIE